MEHNLKIRFKGEEFIVVGDGESLEDGGALTTPELFRNGDCSYAHLMEDGRVLRFGQCIGTISDIEVIGEDHSVLENVFNFFTSRW